MAGFSDEHHVEPEPERVDAIVKACKALDSAQGPGGIISAEANVSDYDGAVSLFVRFAADCGDTSEAALYASVFSFSVDDDGHKLVRVFFYSVF